MDDLLQDFISETLETRDVVSGDLVSWELDPHDVDRLDRLFRFFHTVKGSSGFLDLPRFERLAHVAEDLLDNVRQGRTTVSSELVNAVLALIDRITDLTHCLDQRSELPDESGDEAIVAVARALMNADPAADPEQPTISVAASRPSGNSGVAPAVHAPGDSADADGSADSSKRASGNRTIRVPVTLIEQMMNSVSDMVLARNEVSRKMRDVGVEPELDNSFERLSACVADIRDLVSKTRMQRVERLFQAVPRLVRDLSRDLGKQVELSLEGGDVEMDREMIELVVDPLTHIIRNALDHGIETPQARRDSGKPDVGRLSVIARQTGNRILIEVSDDGRGIDGDALVAKALDSGSLTEADARRMTPQERLELIFRPGLSTAQAVTAISGRGVGMDVVRANVERIGGVVSLESVRGRGCSFQLRVPLTLTIIPGLTVRCGGQFYVVPRSSVIEILHDNNPMLSVETVGGRRVATIRGARRAYVDLEDVLCIPPVEQSGPRSILVVRSTGSAPYALGIQAVDSHEEVVIRPASPVVMAQGIYAGMTLPDSGKPMLLLDTLGIASEVGICGDAEHGLADAVPDQPVAATQDALLFEALDGSQRLMPLAIVERVEDIDAAAISGTGGRQFLRHRNHLVPLFLPPGEPLPQAGILKGLRLTEGGTSCYYPARGVLDVVPIPLNPDVSVTDGHIGGLCIVDDRAVQIVDSFAVFAGISGFTCSTRPLHCHVEAGGEDGWARNLLMPMLRRAGYAVTIDGDATASADWDVLLTLASSPVAVQHDESRPVLWLSDNPAACQTDCGGQAVIHRYDRERLLERLAMLTRKHVA